jgi:hypothetical protein
MGARGHARIRQTEQGAAWLNRRGRGPSLPDLRSADEAQRMLRRIDAAARVADRRDAAPRDAAPATPPPAIPPRVLPERPHGPFSAPGPRPCPPHHLHDPGPHSARHSAHPRGPSRRTPSALTSPRRSLTPCPTSG